MKKTFRRALSMLCALAMVISCLSASVFASPAENLALGATASYITSIEKKGDKADKDRVKDGSTSTLWQINTSKTPDESSYDSTKHGEISVYLTWDDAVSLNQVMVYMPNQVSGGIQIKAYNGDTPLNFGSNIQFINDEYKIDNTGVDSFTAYSKEAVAVTKIEVVLLKAANAYYPEIYEIEAYNSYYVADLQAAIAKAEKALDAGYPDSMTASLGNATSEAKNALNLCHKAAVGSVEGIKTQADLDAYTKAVNEAMAINFGSAYTNEFSGNATLYWNDGKVNNSDNDATQRPAIHDCDKINSNTLTDGDYIGNGGNSWCNWWTAAGDRCYLVFDSAVNLDTLRIAGEHEGYEFEISYLTDIETAEVSWNSLEEAFESATTVNTNANTVIFNSRYAYDLFFDAITDVKAISIKITKHHINGIGLPDSRLFEVEGYRTFTQDGKSFNSDFVKFENTAENKVLFVGKINKKDYDGKVVRAEFTVTRDGEGSWSSSVVIHNAYESMVIGDIGISAADFETYFEGDYLVGILFENVKAGDAFDEIKLRIDDPE